MSKIVVQAMYINTTPDGDKTFRQIKAWKDGDEMDGEVFVEQDISFNKGFFDDKFVGSITITIQED